MSNRASHLSRSTRVLLLFVLCPLVLSGCPQLLCDFGISDLCETYTVSYDANGANSGSGPTDVTSYENGMTVTVLDNIGNLVRTGYAFTGWNTSANGSGTARAPGSTFTMGSANVTLYAVWLPNPTYTVTYKAYDSLTEPVPARFGSVPVDSTSYENGTTVTVLNNTGNLIGGRTLSTGYFFAGWNTSPGGTGTARAPGSTFTMGSSNVSLYAQWGSVCGNQFSPYPLCFPWWAG